MCGMNLNILRRSLLSLTSRRVSLVTTRGMSKMAKYASLQNGYGGRIQIDYKSDVAVITMDRGENRMNDEFIDQMNAALDEALSKPSVRAIITTGRSKFYCNGLDLNWLQEIGSEVPEYLPTFLSRWHKLEHRFLSCPVPTIAAINGHAYAGGGVMSLCHDYRVMQTERGFWCLNEVHIGLNFPMWIIRLCRIKLGGHGARGLTDAVVFGKRFTAEEAKTWGVVDEICRPSELLSTAFALVDAVVPADGFSRDFVEKTKLNLYEEVFSATFESSASFSSRL